MGIESFKKINCDICGTQIGMFNVNSGCYINFGEDYRLEYCVEDGYDETYIDASLNGRCRFRGAICPSCLIKKIKPIVENLETFRGE